MSSFYTEDQAQNDYDGLFTIQSWKNEEGLLHREDGPAYIEQNDSCVLAEEYWVNGVLHRNDGPAQVRRDSYTGAIVFESYWIDGKPHRVDGPAVIDRGSRDVSTEYWINGEYVSGERVPQLDDVFLSQLEKSC